MLRPQVFCLILVMALMCAPRAYATVRGVVSGRVLIFDNRSLSPNTATLGTTVAARRLVVAVTSPAASSMTGGSFINPTNYAVTDANGRFRVQWTDETRGALPIRLRLTITYTSSESNGGGRTPPRVLFMVDGDQETFRRDVTTNNFNLGDIIVDASRAGEESAAYLTTREFFETIVARSRNLRERMPGTVVKVNVEGFGIFSGITPVPHEVWVTPGRAVSNPGTVAHELGHAITWAALQLNSAPINPLSDYMMFGVPGWARDSREFSKAAFLEGMADLWMVVWLGGQNCDPTITQGDRTLNYEAATVIDGQGRVLVKCRTADRPWEFPFCHSAALWDLIDGDTGGDGVDLTIANIIDTMNHFPNNCISNGCRDELGFDALNHLDFLNNSPAARQTAIRGVWQLNGISGGN